MRVRIAGFLAVVGLLMPACSGDDASGGPLSFDLEGQELEGDWPEPTHLSADWGRSTAAVVEAPRVVTAGDDVNVVVELRNPTKESLSLDPCPVWVAWYEGENTGLATTLAGDLPCDAVKRIEAGGRIRLGLTVPSPREVDCHDGYDPDFGWELLQRDDPRIRAPIRVTVAIPMRESDSAPPNDCGAPTMLIPDPPELERI